MRPTRVWDLLAVAVVLSLGVWLLAAGMYSSMPPIRSYTGVSLYLLAAVDVALGFWIRSKVRQERVGPDRRQLHPIMAARAVALAQASAWLGATLSGVWAGILLYVLPERSTLTAAAADTPGAVIGLVGAVILVAAALWLEYCCRAPKVPSQEPAA